MKIFELLETAKKTGDIIARKNPRIGCENNIKYSEKYKRFMGVTETGDLVFTGNPRLCEVALTEDLVEDDFYLVHCKTAEQRLYDLMHNHPVEIEDLETIVEMYDCGVTTNNIVQAVLRAFPYSNYASNMFDKPIENKS